ncbi:hypothetical protein D3C87_105990 [compost metagenome]
MTLETPIQIEIVGNEETETILNYYSNYEASFVILHPFLKIKDGHDLKFERPNNWPTKKQICESTIPIGWSKIVQDAGLNDIKELDRLLAFLHCAHRNADKKSWIKFITSINRNGYIISQVDCFPEILTNRTLKKLKDLGYDEVYHYSDISDTKKLFKVDNLIDSEEALPEPQTRLLTPDKKILFETDFDDRVTYLSSDKKIIEEIVSTEGFEGFYCNNNTKPYWSYEELTGETIDWQSKERYIDYC